MLNEEHAHKNTLIKLGLFGVFLSIVVLDLETIESWLKPNSLPEFSDDLSGEIELPYDFYTANAASKLPGITLPGLGYILIGLRDHFKGGFWVVGLSNDDNFKWQLSISEWSHLLCRDYGYVECPIGSCHTLILSREYLNALGIDTHSMGMESSNELQVHVDSNGAVICAGQIHETNAVGVNEVEVVNVDPSCPIYSDYSPGVEEQCPITDSSWTVGLQKHGYFLPSQAASVEEPDEDHSCSNEF